MILLRLLMTSQQRITVTPETAMIDDMLMYKAAVSISQGQWLGPYSFLAMSKHMFFSIWLAFVHWLGIPYLLAGHILSVITGVVVVLAVSPVVKNHAAKLALLTVLMFCPALFADYTLRVYRDNITTSFTMLVFACVIGAVLRWQDKKTAGFWAFSVTGGLALGISFLLREDGYWLLPFVVCGTVIGIVYMLKNDAPKKIQKLVAMLLILAISGGCVAAYSGMNYKHYDRFVVSDFTSSEFQDAYGAITRIKLPEDANPIVPVNAETRQKLYAASPAFAELENYLEDITLSGRWRKDCGDGVLEFSGGGFYWAIRNAVSDAGYYKTAQTAAAYYTRVAQELNAAYDNGTLEAQTGKRSALNTPLTGRYVWPTFAEVGASFWAVTSYQGIACDPEISEGSRMLCEEIEDYANNRAMMTTLTPTSNRRVVVWAVSAEGPVEITLNTITNDPADAYYYPSTGSDVFLMFLDKEITLPYSDGCRTTAIYNPVAETLMIGLSCGETSITVPVMEMTSYAEQDGIYYRVEYVGSDYTESIEYGRMELWMYRGMRAVTWIYRILSPAVLLFAFVCLFWTVAHMFKDKKKKGKDAQPGLLLWIVAGLGLSALLRLGMVAFVEVSAFGIGTNPMYLSAVYPLGILFSFLCIVLWRRSKREVRAGDDETSG